MRWNRHLFSKLFFGNPLRAVTLFAFKMLTIPSFGIEFFTQFKQIIRIDRAPASIESGMRTVTRACFEL
jgi:hypothetical protein